MIFISGNRQTCWAWGVLYVSALLLGPLAPVSAQQPDQPEVREVRFEGLDQTGEVFARGVARIDVGTPFTAPSADAAVERLLRTGRFLTVRYRTDPVAGGVRVTFSVRERPTITAILFDGNSRYSDAHLLSRVGLSVGTSVDMFAVRQGQGVIAAVYREGGHGDVVVTFDEDRARGSGEIVYVIEEGSRVRIREVRFEGATAFGHRELIRRIDTRPAWWIIRKGVYDEDRVESDVARLRSYFRDHGFLDAKVSYRREFGEKEGDLILVFTIAEGTRYSIERIRLMGHTVFSSEELSAEMASAVGAFVRRPVVAEDAAAIQRKYREYGYIYATVRPIRDYSDEPDLVQITMEIAEGRQFRVGEIVVRGNYRTKDKVVRRALDLYPPFDLVNMTKAKEAEERLRQAGIFTSARVVPVGDDPEVRDIIMDVEEADRIGDFNFALGVTSNAGLVGSINLDLKNFDLHDKPRSFSELVKLRSFFGAGQRMRIELQPGTDVSRFRVDFTEPYLFDRPIRFDASGYLFSRSRDGYQEQRSGVTLSFGKTFDRGRLQGWTGELAFRIESVSADDIDLFASSEIRDSEGSNLLTSAKVSLVRNRTDNRLLPTSGDLWRFSYEQTGVLGGDFGFGKFTAGYTRHITLRTDILNRKTVLHLKANLGFIAGDAPVFERFYAGGIGSLRGFEFRGVGPRDGLDDNNIGGDFMLLVGGEYTFPLYGETIQGLVFLDAGTVESGLRAAIGAGVRLTLNLPMFGGPIPLEFALAAPISMQSGDETRILSFSIGTSF